MVAKSINTPSGAVPSEAGVPRTEKNQVCAICGVLLSGFDNGLGKFGIDSQKLSKGLEVRGAGAVLVCDSCGKELSAEIERVRSEGKPIRISGIVRRLFKTHQKTSIYILSDIPGSLWRQARSKALMEGKTMREVILEALDAYGQK